MIPAICVSMGEGAVVVHCLANNIGIGSIESLPGGGTKIVCRTAAEASLLRLQLTASSIKSRSVLKRNWPSGTNS